MGQTVSAVWAENPSTVGGQRTLPDPGVQPVTSLPVESTVPSISGVTDQTKPSVSVSATLLSEKSPSTINGNVSITPAVIGEDSIFIPCIRSLGMIKCTSVVSPAFSTTGLTVTSGQPYW